MNYRSFNFIIELFNTLLWNNEEVIFQYDKNKISYEGVLNK